LIKICQTHKEFRFFDEKKRMGHTNMLMMTLTYDAKKCDWHEAWLNIGKDLNRFLSALKQKYGKVAILRSFETYRNGYPHVHFIALFKEHDFRVKRYRNKNGRIEWLIPRYDDEKISGFHHSYVKINGVQTIHAVPYVVKYCMKGVFQEDNKETLVRCWLYRKRQYSISKTFVRDLMSCLDCDPLLLDILMHNSNNSMIMGYDFVYVGVKRIDNVDRRIVRLRPPPIKIDDHGCDIDISEIYMDHDKWLRDFTVNDCWCSDCGVPLFFDEEQTIQIDEENIIVCTDCFYSEK